MKKADKYLKIFKTNVVIRQNKQSVYSICLLKDKRLASCSQENSIKIFSLETYKCEIEINDHNDWVSYVSILENGDLISSSYDFTIRIWEIYQNNYKCVKIINSHTDIVSKAIQITGMRIGSCSHDSTIRIYKSHYPFECIKVLKGHTGFIKNLIELKGKNYICSCGKDSTLRFWNTSNFSCEKVVKGISCCSNNALAEIQGNQLLIGDKVIMIVDLQTFQLKTKIKLNDVKIRKAYCFLELGDNTVLCGIEKGMLVKIDLNEYKTLDVIENAHKERITGLIEYNNNFISCSNDCEIKIWNL